MQSSTPRPFYKYNSNGNDFILIEGHDFKPRRGWSHWCHRRFGIGADGILFFQESRLADFKMVYLNADGREVGMCGNGARAVARHFFSHMMKDDQKETCFEVGPELYRARLCRDGRIAVSMNEYRGHGAIALEGLNRPREVVEMDYLDTGVPHLVCEWQGSSLEQAPLNEWAPIWRRDARFSEGVNVNFFLRVGEVVHVRTYERGVEAETWACGTGVVAVARHLWKGQKINGNQISFRVRGGRLDVEKDRDALVLIGESECVFQGHFQD